MSMPKILLVWPVEILLKRLRRKLSTSGRRHLGVKMGMVRAEIRLRVSIKLSRLIME